MVSVATHPNKLNFLQPRPKSDVDQWIEISWRGRDVWKQRFYFAIFAAQEKTQPARVIAQNLQQLRTLVLLCLQGQPRWKRWKTSRHFLSGHYECFVSLASAGVFQKPGAEVKRKFSLRRKKFGKRREPAGV